MISIIQTLAEDTEDAMFRGVLHGWQNVIGIVMAVTGLLIIYFGIKIVKGYRFLPQKEQNIPKEDNFVSGRAKALQKKKTSMPSFNGGEPSVFVEWKIGYEVDGEKYTQLIPDDGYQKGDFLDIKYNPDNPEEYYIDSKTETSDETEQEQQTDSENNSMGWLCAGIGLLIAVIGVMLAL